MTTVVRRSTKTVAGLKTAGLKTRPTETKDRDRETRDRLLSVATRLFSERGFSKVTVREICGEANANVAAVNYHFGDKTGLYDEVLRSAIRIMQGTTEEMKAAGEGKRPEERLEICIHVFLTRIVAARDSWIHRLMMHELTEPTPALDTVVNEVMRPRADYIRETIAAIIGCKPDDVRVGHCGMSVHSQMIALINNPVAARLKLQPDKPLTPEYVEKMATHIARFSVAGIRAIAKT